MWFFCTFSVCFFAAQNRFFHVFCYCAIFSYYSLKLQPPIEFQCNKMVSKAYLNHFLFQMMCIPSNICVMLICIVYAFKNVYLYSMLRWIFPRKSQFTMRNDGYFNDIYLCMCSMFKLFKQCNEFLVFSPQVMNLKWHISAYL